MTTVSVRLGAAFAVLLGSAVAWAQPPAQPRPNGITTNPGVYSPSQVGRTSLPPGLNAPSATITSVGPYSGSPASASITSVMPSFVPPPYSPADYYYYNPYYNYDPLGGSLRGAASVINAQGRYQIDHETANILHQQYQQARQESRRKIWEEWLWERANTLTLQDLREQTQRQERRRALTTPPDTEVWSGTSLNVLLDLAKTSKDTANLLNTPLSEDIVKHLNINTGSNYNLSAVKQIKDDQGLNWPLVLRAPDYENEVKKIDQLLSKAVKAAADTGKVEAGVLNDAAAALRQLEAKLDDRAPNLTPTQYTSAQRFLKQLRDAVNAMEQPDVKKYFNNLQNVRTVGDLVKEMNSRGLRFAPAASGDEAAYAAVHGALARYTSGIPQDTQLTTPR